VLISFSSFLWFCFVWMHHIHTDPYWWIVKFFSVL
jgi:hypothetical protein